MSPCVLTINDAVVNCTLLVTVNLIWIIYPAPYPAKLTESFHPLCVPVFIFIYSLLLFLFLDLADSRFYLSIIHKLVLFLTLAMITIYFYPSHLLHYFRIFIISYLII